MNEMIYKSIIQESLMGYAYHKIICNDEGIPCDCQFLDINPAFERLTGLKKDQVIGKNMTDILPGFNEEIAEWIQPFGHIALYGGKKELKVFFKPLQRWYNTHTYSPQKDYFITTFSDISAEIHHQGELERFFSVNPDLLCIADTSGNFLKVNKAWENTLGYDISDLEGQCFLDFIHPDDISSTLQALSTLSNQEQVLNFTNRYRSKDGTYRYIQWRSHPHGRFIYAAARDITDMVQTQHLLHEKEENFRTFFETMDDIIFVASPQGRFLYVNKAAKEKLGYTEEEFRQMDFPALHSVLHRREAAGLFAAMCSKERDYCPLPLAKKDGALIPSETRVWFGKWNGSECIFGISKDLTSQQAALDKFHKLFDNNPELMAVTTAKEGWFTEVNATFLEKLGYTREEVIGKNSQDLQLFIDPDKRLSIGEALRSNGRIRNQELQVRTKGGEVLTGLFSGERIENQLEDCFLTVMTDITLLKKAQEDLHVTSQRLKLATQAANVGIWEYDVASNTLVWDETMYKLYGITAETFSGAYEAWEQGLHPDDLAYCREAVQKTLAGDQDFSPEFRVVWPDGSIHYIKANALLIYNQDNRPVKMIGTNWDVTERYEHEAELIQAKEQAESANIMKSQFVANMSHEIRTPMNGIMGYLELLNRSNLSSEQRSFIREAKAASDVLLYLINDILDISKIEAGKLTMEKIHFNLRTAVEDAVSLLMPRAREKNLTLLTAIHPQVPEQVMGDPARLRQIINNLVSNAVKFTEKGKVIITLSSSGEPDGRTRIQFEIKDTGIGISADAIPKLFKPFTQADASTTRKFGGTGLGLAISKELVKMMDGDITVESIPGQGSQFTFFIRLEAIQLYPHCRLSKSIRNTNVLVVHESVSTRNRICSYLEDCGCKTFQSQRADKAITTILTQANTENTIDVAIIDYHLPDMNGCQLATALQAIPSAQKVKLILLTLARQKNDVDQTCPPGVCGYVTKPVRRDDLLQCMNSIVDGKESSLLPPPENKLTKKAQPAWKPSILLVEDNEINRKIVLLMLKSQGLTCDIAVDGFEAVTAVSAKDYDIIFMDCQMPVMDGYQATEQIRKLEANKKHTIIIAMTANAMEGDRAKCLDAGMDDYLSKPINFDVMLNLLNTYTRQIHPVT